MAALDAHIKRINDKLQHLLKQYQGMQKENERLKATVKKLQGENEGKANEIEQLHLQANILKSAAGKMAEADKKAFEKKISQYLKDVDKAITLLSE